MGGDEGGPNATPPPTTAQDCPRLWLRVHARCLPIRMADPATSTSASSRYTVYAKVKFPIAAVPQWIIRFVIRTMAPMVISRVRELLPRLMDPNSDSAFPVKMRADPVLYKDLLDTRVRRFLQTKDRDGTSHATIG